MKSAASTASTPPRPTFGLAGLLAAVTAIAIGLALLRHLQTTGDAATVGGLFLLALAVGLFCGALVANDPLRRAYWGVVCAWLGGLGSVALQELVRLWTGR